jgi:hypothetical protein
MPLSDDDSVMEVLISNWSKRLSLMFADRKYCVYLWRRPWSLSRSERSISVYIGLAVF